MRPRASPSPPDGNPGNSVRSNQFRPEFACQTCSGPCRARVPVGSNLGGSRRPDRLIRDLPFFLPGRRHPRGKQPGRPPAPALDSSTALPPVVTPSSSCRGNSQPRSPASAWTRKEPSKTARGREESFETCVAGGTEMQQVTNGAIAPMEPCSFFMHLKGKPIFVVSHRLRADVTRYIFIVADFHHLLLAGLPAHPTRLHDEP